MYPNKLTTDSMSSYDFFILIFFHEVSCFTCHKFVLSQQDCKIGPCVDLAFARAFPLDGVTRFFIICLVKN